MTTTAKVERLRKIFERYSLAMTHYNHETLVYLRIYVVGNDGTFYLRRHLALRNIELMSDEEMERLACSIVLEEI